MRNQFGGQCYRCLGYVKPGEGHFERTPELERKWRVQHATCAIEYRGIPDAYSQLVSDKQRERTIKRWKEHAAGTGKIAQRARLRLRQLNLLPSGEQND